MFFTTHTPSLAREPTDALMKIDMPPLPPMHHVVPTQKPQAVAETSAHPVAQQAGTSSKDAARFSAAMAEVSKSLNAREVLVGEVTQFAKSMKAQELYGLLMGPQNAGMNAAVMRMRKQLRLQAGVATLESGGGETEERGVETVMQAAGGDPSVAHVLLHTALHDIAKRKKTTDIGDPETSEEAAEKARLEGYLRILEVRHGKQAFAGINTAKVFSRVTKDPKGRKTLRDHYYATVIGDQTLVRMITALLEHADPQGNLDRESFLGALNYLKSAIADDLAALRPSIKSSHLKTLMKGLATAAKLGALFEHCATLLQRMRKLNPALSVTAPALLRDLLGIGEQRAQAVAALVTRMGGNSLKHQLVFLNGLSPVMKELESWWKVDKNSKNPFASLLLLRNQLTIQEKKLDSNAPAPAIGGPAKTPNLQAALPGPSTERAIGVGS